MLLAHIYTVKKISVMVRFLIAYYLRRFEFYNNVFFVILL